MAKSLTRRAIGVYLIYVLAAGLAAAGARVGGVVFRQYLRIANELILTGGLIAVLLIRCGEIPAERKRRRTAARIITAAVILFVLLAVFLQVFMGIDKESVTQRDGGTKIEVERGWIMFLERSYYDYKNILWYAREPHCTESYDDGSPSQFLYTDYYDEDGVFTERVYPDEAES